MNLAGQLMDILLSGTKNFASQPTLRILAIGAKMFEDVTFGIYRFPCNELRDFLRIRVYAVEYGRCAHSASKAWAANMVLRARGIVGDDRDHDGGDLSIFKLSWLDHLPCTAE